MNKKAEVALVRPRFYNMFILSLKEFDEVIAVTFNYNQRHS